MRPTVLDLYCGAGGFSLGMEMAGFKIIAAVDHSPVHCLTHKYNFPDCDTFHSPVSRIDLSKYNPDVIIGGPPCTSFSMAGKQAPDDYRSNEVHVFARKIVELQPKYFIMENVPPLISNPKFKTILEEFYKILYAGGFLVNRPIHEYNAKDFGVCQNRERIFILGYRHDMIPLINLVVDPVQPQMVKEMIDDLRLIKPFINQKDSGIDRNELAYFHIPGSRGRKYSMKVFNHIATSHGEEVKKRFKETKPGSREPISHFKKLNPAGVCNTLTAGTTPDRGAHTAARPIHYSLPRCISVREAARLHSFPDWFTFQSSVYYGFQQIGNSVPPLLARGIGRHLLKYMKNFTLVDSDSSIITPQIDKKYLSMGTVESKLKVKEVCK